MNVRLKAIGFLSVLFPLVLFPSLVFAAEFKVSPIRLFLDKQTKSDGINVTNTGKGEFKATINATEWTQNEDGKDNYTETKDLIFYPRYMTIKENETRVVRVGIKKPPLEKEKTYRVFIEEMPERKETTGTQVAIALRFGAPVFVRPLAKEVINGEIARIELKNSNLAILVKNIGNVYFTIQGIEIKGENEKGEEAFKSELGGWYLLNGASRPYAAQIPPEVCKEIKTVKIRVNTESSGAESFRLDGRVDVDKTMCLP